MRECYQHTHDIYLTHHLLMLTRASRDFSSQMRHHDISNQTSYIQYKYQDSGTRRVHVPAYDDFRSVRGCCNWVCSNQDGPSDIQKNNNIGILGQLKVINTKENASIRGII